MIHFTESSKLSDTCTKVTISLQGNVQEFKEEIRSLEEVRAKKNEIIYFSIKVIPTISDKNYETRVPCPHTQCWLQVGS